jgi:hypothetical protein
LQSLGSQFISVHSKTLKFNSTAEVIAEVKPLHAIGPFSLRGRPLVIAGGLITGLSIRWRPGATARNCGRC